MSIRKTLIDLAHVVSDEAEQNPEFSARLLKALRIGPAKKRASVGSSNRADYKRPIRPSNRRPPPVLDPIEIAVEGEQSLRKALEPLTIHKLKDIVADYGMDQRRLVMKWKTRQRIINHIVGISIERAHKGDAFRK